MSRSTNGDSSEGTTARGYYQTLPVSSTPYDGSLFALDHTMLPPQSHVYPEPFGTLSPPHMSSGSQSMHSPSASSHSMGGDSSNYRQVTPGSGYLDASSPSAYDGMSSGYSASTTPGFDMDDFPDLDENVMYDVEQNAPQQTHIVSVQPPSARNSASTTGYPPSPQPTESPTSVHLSPKFEPQRMMLSPVVKVENFSPENTHVHPSPMSQRADTGSSASSVDGGNLTIRRDEDGGWRGGLNPEIRDEGGNTGYLSENLKEMEARRAKEEKNAEVEDWLKKSAEQLPNRRVTGQGLAPPNSVRRRSKSIGDFREGKLFEDRPIMPGESSSGNISGIVLDDEDGVYEDDSGDDSSVASDYNEGSLDEPLTVNDKDKDVIRSRGEEMPPSEDVLRRAAKKEEEEERKRREEDEANLPKPHQFFKRRPWDDNGTPTLRGAPASMRNQPTSSNAAIAKFKRYNDNIETASRVATFGSDFSKGRRNSAGDADRLIGPIKRLSFGRDKHKDRDREGTGLSRRPSLWRGLKRSLSNSGGDTLTPPQSGPTGNVLSRKRGHSTSGSSPFSPSKLGPSFGQPPLKVETNSIGSAFAQMASPLMAAGAGQSSQSAKTGTTSPPGKLANSFQNIVTRVQRTRSKSEIQRGMMLGVVSNILGPALNTSVNSTPPTDDPDVKPGEIEKKFTFGEESSKRGAAEARQLLSPNDAVRSDQDDEDEPDEDDPNGQAAKNFPPKLPKLDIVPTVDGFAENVRTLTPNLTAKLVDRIAHEQCKRYKKLVDHRHKHLAALNAGGQCTNGMKCKRMIGAIGVGGDGPVSVSAHKRGVSKASFDGDADRDSDDDGAEVGSDGNVASAQFPPGVPTPPVSRLPAEFECPICFKVKMFKKPSDWTKHVHEDVQPFTCTFPDCTEPKSFKRKADWVRHENERHRHLEWWTCKMPDCTHTCYRKDNFVQHLVREHKMAEPKIKAQKAAKKGGNALTESEEISRLWHLVDDCHHNTEALPLSEQCRFCGNSCNSWKKLTVHLARHMEAISLPVLDLIRDDAIIPPSTRRTIVRSTLPAAASYSTGPGPSHVLQQGMSRPQPNMHQCMPQSQGNMQHGMPMYGPSGLGATSPLGKRQLSTEDYDHDSSSNISSSYTTPVVPSMAFASSNSVPTYRLSPPQDDHHTQQGNLGDVPPYQMPPSRMPSVSYSAPHSSGMIDAPMTSMGYPQDSSSYQYHQSVNGGMSSNLGPSDMYSHHGFVPVENYESASHQAQGFVNYSRPTPHSQPLPQPMMQGQNMNGGDNLMSEGVHVMQPHYGYETKPGNNAEGFVDDFNYNYARQMA